MEGECGGWVDLNSPAALSFALIDCAKNEHYTNSH